MDRPAELKSQDRVTKYMTFQLVARKTKTTVWLVVNNKSGSLLGGIEWYSHWRQYIFETYDHRVFNNSCLNDISQFLTELNTNQRKPKPTGGKQ